MTKVLLATTPPNKLPTITLPATWETPPALRISDDLLATLVAEPAPKPYGARQRVYVDTSVVGGCKEDEFREPSQRLFDAFVRGEHTLVLSQLTEDELEGAPQAIRDVLASVPCAHLERVKNTEDADRLALAYIEARGLAPSMKSDAQHIALATLAEADSLVSWNFKHIVNPWRINICRFVNMTCSHKPIKIISPENMEYHDQ